MEKRSTARLVIVDPADRVLLFHFIFDQGPLAGEAFWALPGGVLQPGESFHDTAIRELFEETGLRLPVGDPVDQIETEFRDIEGTGFLASEKLFRVYAPSAAIDTGGMSEDEARLIRSHLWWSQEELKETAQTVYPTGLAELLAETIAQRPVRKGQIEISC